MSAGCQAGQGNWHIQKRYLTPWSPRHEGHHAISPILRVEWVHIQFGMAVWYTYWRSSVCLPWGVWLPQLACVCAWERQIQQLAPLGWHLSQLKRVIHPTISLSLLSPLSVLSSFCPILGVMLVRYQHPLTSLGRWQDRDAWHLAASGNKNVSWVTGGAPRVP